MQDIKWEWGFSSKMNSIRETFGRSGENYGIGSMRIEPSAHATLAQKTRGHTHS